MDFLSGIVLGFTLVLTRVGAFFAVFPLFSWKVIPVQSEGGDRSSWRGFFSQARWTCPVRPQDAFGLQSILMIINEAIYGSGIGIGLCPAVFGRAGQRPDRGTADGFVDGQCVRPAQRRPGRIAQRSERDHFRPAVSGRRADIMCCCNWSSRVLCDIPSEAFRTSDG